MRIERLFPWLGLALLGSAFLVVHAKHHSRQHFVELEALKARRDALDIEWNRLLLEQATWATPTRIERVARDRLRMRLPPADQIVIVDP